MAEKFTYITLEEEIEEAISTKENVVKQLDTIGIQKGMVLLVQADTSKLGIIAGGLQTIIDALMDAVGFEGTIVMPTFTLDLLDPSCQDNAIPRRFWKEVRASSNPYHKKLSAPYLCDPLVLQFLRNEGVTRSYHPLYSFAAWGKYAKLICDKHPLHFGLSKESPLGKILEFNGYALLLGCDYAKSVIFHVASYNGEKQPVRILSAPIQNNQNVQWKKMLEIDFQQEDRKFIGAVLEDRSIVNTSYIGNGKCCMFSAREAVKLAIAYDHLERKEKIDFTL